MHTLDKLKLLADAARYDVACTSSGVQRQAQAGSIGSAAACGICHSFAADGRCISLLKVLLTNACAYDCRYCVNRRSADFTRTSFEPGELADLTLQFYRRNYIEGLFLSSAVYRSADFTSELMIKTLRILKQEHRFAGYIHVKAIPGADPRLLDQLGTLADRVSLNIELPSSQSLALLAPDKSRESILSPMAYLAQRSLGEADFAPAGMSTQMIIGASPDTDLQIMRLTESLYHRYRLKRVFFSAYMPVVEDSLLPALDTEPSLQREHRLYQADWLLRFYGFRAEELLDERNQNFHLAVDPKLHWALHNPSFFPVEVNNAQYWDLLRVPGIGVTGAKRIVRARRQGNLHFDGLKRLGVTMRRAQYFITCLGRGVPEGLLPPDPLLGRLVSGQAMQLSYLETLPLLGEEKIKWLVANQR